MTEPEAIEILQKEKYMVVKVMPIDDRAILAEQMALAALASKRAEKRHKVNGVLWCWCCSTKTENKWNYCPRCGAKFKRDDTDENDT